MTITPTHPHASALGPTASLDAVEPPAGPAAAGSGPSAPPGRYLVAERDGCRRLLPLSRRITHLGRGFAATVHLEDAGVSRRHAIVVQRGGRVHLLDDRSANGTFVNGRRVVETELRSGDVIVLGRAVLVFLEVPAAAVRLGGGLTQLDQVA